MPTFRGFPEGKVRLTPIPEPFFTEVLDKIRDVHELKLLLYIFWRLNRMEGTFRYLRRADFLQDEQFLQIMGNSRQESEAALDQALQGCVAHGVLLKTSLALTEGDEDFYFLNSARGRAAVQAIARGEWRPSGRPQTPLEILPQPPNIFRLYEEHIGPLTPMMADMLREAEQTYPAHWIEEAIRLAVENNVRRWSYVEAILNRWQKEGRDERKDRGDTEKDRRRYIEGEYADFVEH